MPIARPGRRNSHQPRSADSNRANHPVDPRFRAAGQRTEVRRCSAGGSTASRAAATTFPGAARCPDRCRCARAAPRAAHRRLRAAPRVAHHRLRAALPAAARGARRVASIRSVLSAARRDSAPGRRGTDAAALRCCPARGVAGQDGHRAAVRCSQAAARPSSDCRSWSREASARGVIRALLQGAIRSSSREGSLPARRLRARPAARRGAAARGRASRPAARGC